MKKRISFKIFPIKGDKDYYQVIVFPDRLSMRMASLNMYGPVKRDGVSGKAEAVTHSFSAQKKVGKKWVESDCVGVIMFYEGGFGAGVVSHEIAHAMNYMFLRRDVPFNLRRRNQNWVDFDEIYATCNGYMNNQFWKKYAKATGKKNLYERY